MMIEGKVKMTDLGEIRDSWNLTALSKVKEGDFFRPVSYTHLTLPTIYSV